MNWLLFFIVSCAGWLIPVVFLLVSGMAASIPLCAAISVLDGLVNPTPAQPPANS